MVELHGHRVVISLPSDQSVKVRVVGFGQLHFGRSTFYDARVAQPTQYKGAPDHHMQVKGRGMDPYLCTNQPVSRVP